MAASRKLKVYRTPIGFHDAYVAAPSQKAALAAWGSTHDLFARGVAELVRDPALAAEPLAHPGKVVKVLRGTPAEQQAARAAGPKSSRRAPEPAPPPPSRADLDAAEQALADLSARHGEEERTLAAAAAELAARRRAAAAAYGKAQAALERKRVVAARAYDKAMARWRG